MEKETYYKVFDSDDNLLFDSKNERNFLYKAQNDGEYFFILLPYKIENGEFVYGEKIKLPSVLVEGKKDILNTNWWED
ncbi:MAG: hypothetical protein IKA99_06045 [Clostridia bacterium]|nr:hypothetical protein [Clostridia bacterium]